MKHFSKMQVYGDGIKRSGVTHYALADEAILIEFRGGARYVYDYVIPGRHAVERMKQLAETGTGLSTYIAQYIRERYAAKTK